MYVIVAGNEITEVIVQNAMFLQTFAEFWGNIFEDLPYTVLFSIVPSIPLHIA